VYSWGHWSLSDRVLFDLVGMIYLFNQSQTEINNSNLSVAINDFSLEQSPTKFLPAACLAHKHNTTNTCSF
jgi:hypothetical protein